jgi:thioredoxin-like negative regulator of GroEL
MEARDSMKALEYLHRAKELLSRGQEELAESALGQALDSAVAADSLVLLTQARLALGELMVEQARKEEALPFLMAVVRTELADGSVDVEVKRAAHLLRQLRGIVP